MENLKQAVGPIGTKDPPALVGINLTTAGHLTTALEEVGRDLRTAARRALAAAGRAGLLPVAAAQLEATASWAEEQARALHRLLARLGAEPVPGVTRWRGGTAAGFADPAEAHRLGLVLAGAVRAGDLDRAERLLARHGSDPVVATVLVERLGARALVDLLAVAHRTWAATIGDAAQRREVVLGLGRALAAASRQGTATVDLEDLAAAARRATVAPAALALLFAGGARYATPFLRQAMAVVVRPINQGLKARPGTSPDPFLIAARERPLDARVLVLRAVAEDRQAAVDAVGAADLDELLDPALAYLDGGVALARVLVAATTPLDRAGRAVADPLTTALRVRPGVAGDNARRVIEWIGIHGTSPLAVQVELGRLARPWIGSFRSDGLEVGSRRHLDLDPEAARAFLRYAHTLTAPSRALEEAAWTWAATELDHLTRPAAGGGGFAAVGSVLGVVTVTRLDAAADRAADGDDEAERRGRLWRRAVGLALGRLPPTVRPVVAPLVQRALGGVLPRTDRELVHWRELRDVEVVDDYLALDHLVASTLWARHGHGGLAPAPPELLVDPDRPDLGLRLPVELDDEEVSAWTAWRTASARGGPAPLQVTGDRFLLETRR